MGIFNLDKNKNLIFVSAEIKKGKRSVFLKLALDTGATYTMISYELLASIGVNLNKPKRSIDVTTGSGVILTPIVTVPVFRSLGQEIKNLEVVCHDLPSEGIVDGLLGLNFLKHFNIELRFIDKKLVVKNISQLTAQEKLAYLGGSNKNMRSIRRKRIKR
ncbi:MAG: TIGR02281 family clan AA aspartic protease [Elusimicrobiota bacterium]